MCYDLASQERRGFNIHVCIYKWLLEDVTVDNAVIDVNGFGINVQIGRAACRERV